MPTRGNQKNCCKSPLYRVWSNPFFGFLELASSFYFYSTLVSTSLGDRPCNEEISSTSHTIINNMNEDNESKVVKEKEDYLVAAEEEDFFHVLVRSSAPASVLLRQCKM